MFTVVTNFCVLLTTLHSEWTKFYTFLDILNTIWIIKLSLHMGMDTTKPVFGFSTKQGSNQFFPATETSQKIEISLVASLDMIFSKK